MDSIQSINPETVKQIDKFLKLAHPNTKTDNEVEDLLFFYSNVLMMSENQEFEEAENFNEAIDAIGDQAFLAIACLLLASRLAGDDEHDLNRILIPHLFKDPSLDNDKIGDEDNILPLFKAFGNIGVAIEMYGEAYIQKVIDAVVQSNMTKFPRNMDEVNQTIEKYRKMGTEIECDLSKEENLYSCRVALSQDPIHLPKNKLVKSVHFEEPVLPPQPQPKK